MRLNWPKLASLAKIFGVLRTFQLYHADGVDVFYDVKPLENQLDRAQNESHYENMPVQIH